MDKPDQFYPAIDGDAILYRCGFAVEKRIYRYLKNDQEFESKKDLENFVLQEEGPVNVKLHLAENYEVRKEAEPVENALANIKSVLQDILKVTDASDYSLFISSNTPTFRDDIATIREYKGNRADMEKPIHYKACVEYIVNTWKAEFCIGIEADDACGIHQAENPETSVIVSNDKDMLQIPGWHYNWTKPDSEPIYIDEDTAVLNKYVQVLSGDATDNIEGLPGIGDAKAEKLLLHMYGCDEEDFDEFCRAYYHTYFEDEKKNRFLKCSPKFYLEGILNKTVDEVYEETKTLITILKEPLNEELS